MNEKEKYKMLKGALFSPNVNTRNEDDTLYRSLYNIDKNSQNGADFSLFS